MLSRHELTTCTWLLAAAFGCRSGAAPAANPALPKPAAPASPVYVNAIQRSDRDAVPIRPEQAPLVTIDDIVQGKIAPGQRVRVSGRCITDTSTHSAGFWTLIGDSVQIEVRGLVPKSCPGRIGQPLTIFAQVEWRTASGPEPLLLRLPG